MLNYHEFSKFFFVSLQSNVFPHMTFFLTVPQKTLTRGLTVIIDSPFQFCFELRNFNLHMPIFIIQNKFCFSFFNDVMFANKTIFYVQFLLTEISIYEVQLSSLVRTINILRLQIDTNGSDW